MGSREGTGVELSVFEVGVGGENSNYDELVPFFYFLCLLPLRLCECGVFH